MLYLDMKYLIIICVGIIIIVVIVFYLRGCDSPEPIVEDIRQAETIYRVKIDSIHALRKADFEKMKQDSVKAKVAETAFKIEISRLRKKIAWKKDVAMPVIQSDSNVMELVAFYDTTIVTLENRIDTLQKEKQTQWVSFNKMLTDYDSEVAANKEINKIFQNSLGELTKENKKLKRRSKILAVLIPVVVCGVLVAK